MYNMNTGISICQNANLRHYPVVNHVAEQEFTYYWNEVKKGIEMISSCPAAKQLWDNIWNMGNFSIHYVSKQDTMTHPAWVNWKDREIFLTNFKSKSHKNPPFQSILFELNNLGSSDSIQKIAKSICTLDPVDYAKNIEDIEELSQKNTDRIISECVQEEFWVSEALTAVSTPDPYNDFWSRAFFSGHPSFYLLQWYRACEPQNIMFMKEQMLQWKARSGIPLPPNFHSKCDPQSL